MSTQATTSSPKSTARASSQQAAAASVPPFRRLVTTHHERDTDGSQVTLHDDAVPLREAIPGGFITPLYTTLGMPTHNPHVVTPEHITRKMAAPKGVVVPNGTNCQVTHLLPGVRVDMHRTSSVDYNIILEGSAWLIVPDGRDENGQGGESRTQVNAGEVVVQTGTVHAWQAGPEGVRWVSVLVSADPVVTPSGDKLPDVDL
ncbi:hypothetical protein IAU60_006830 [Kwoniella sp. DSM 27419]